MAKIHYCTCRLNLSGQNCHIVNYTEFNPVTWPEAQVLMALHGDENVMDIVPVRIGDIAPVREKERLIMQYGYRIVEQCFPGRNFRMALMMTDDEQLPVYVEDGSAPPPDEATIERDVAQLAAQAPVFRPGRNKPPEASKEA
jgi:hypothetical protein